MWCADGNITYFVEQAVSNLTSKRMINQVASVHELTSENMCCVVLYDVLRCHVTCK